MIKKQRHTEDFNKKIGFELASGLSSAGKISNREGLSSTTFYKWRDHLQKVSAKGDGGIGYFNIQVY